MHTAAHPAQKHNLISETAFRVKAFLFTINRFIKNGLITRIPNSKKDNVLGTAPVVSFSESELWNTDDTESNWILTAGKIENLRIAARKLNGIEVKANVVFSFWQHIGMPSRLRGFVVGREIREGCIVPTIAGGLCQLSNALYDAALKAGFDIVERHKHTRVIKGSLAEHNRDATVKWNYVDLRFKSAHDFKIVIDFTSDKLIVLFKSYEKIRPLQQKGPFISPSKLNDCFSCGNTDCFKHPGAVVLNKQKQITTYILDEKWPEYEEYIRSNSTAEACFIVPFTTNSRVKIGRYSWRVNEHSKTFSFMALQRAVFIRRAARANGKIPSVYLKYDDKIINSIKNAISIKSTHIVITQNLLPFAWQQGLLWGRTYDVLMTRLPMEILQQQLDNAHLVYQDSKTLSDFRVSRQLIGFENAALTKARHIITPHNQIAHIFNNKCIKLNWVSPPINKIHEAIGNKVLFPASALARKGAYEVRKLAKELNINLVVTGKAVENEGFWDGLNITYASADVFEDIKLVILPAYIEHQPRLLLKAIALNIPVVATAACGIAPSKNVTIIPDGDYEALKNAVQRIYFNKQVELI